VSDTGRQPFTVPAQVALNDSSAPGGRMNMSIRAKHNTGIAEYTALFINMYNAFFIPFNGTADAAM
jgi:hypothetical protein